MNRSGAVEVKLSKDEYDGPVDLDALFQSSRQVGGAAADDDGSLFSDDDDDESGKEPRPLLGNPKLFSNPHRRLLDKDASQIPGSPFSKPRVRRSNRPSEPLAIAKYASTVALMLTIGWLAALFWVILDNTPNTSVAHTIVEVILTIFAFMGLFWNSYFLTAMIFKCFIPKKAFTTNTKYCSIIPEPKPDNAPWLSVTIQIPVYKESLYEVLMPTLKSCQAARDYYHASCPGARCNIVVCDDGIMALLQDNFAAAEMLWKSIQDSKGKYVRLSRLLKNVPRQSRRHLKGLRSQHVYEVFHRMLYYYHYNIGFVARSMVDRRGKFKKASNLNSHLRLALGAQQRILLELADLGDSSTGLSDDELNGRMEKVLLEEAHNDDGSRYVMFGNDIGVGSLICVNDADARMAETVIGKTVPEFLNDPKLGFTQHTTKTMSDQRGESYYTNLLATYTDALYCGHFLLSSIMGCHPPLVGHSIFLRTEAVSQVGRMRTLRKAQRWLANIGLPFLPVDQVGFGNLQASSRTEYWSEEHVSEDFELMIHFYNLGFNGRYCAYEDCEFEEGITRYFDEEAGRHRKFALGAHELVFNSFQDMFGHGVFSPLFRTFLTCDIPSYYKVFLTAYLCSYSSGGVYIIVFCASALVRIFDSRVNITSLNAFSPAGVIFLNFVVYFLLGYLTFMISLLRMYSINNKLVFKEYRKKWCGGCYLLFCMLRYSFVFQILFYNVATFTFYFLGSMDHLMARPGVVGATNKDSINISRCRALWDTIKFNSSSWAIALIMAALGYLTVVVDLKRTRGMNLETEEIIYGFDPHEDTVEGKIIGLAWDSYDNYWYPVTRSEIVRHALYAGPPLFLALIAIVVPLILNPWIVGWPFYRQPKNGKPDPSKQQSVKSFSGKKDALGRDIVDIPTFMNAAKQLNQEIERVQDRPDVELGSLATKENFTVGSPTSGGRKGVQPFYLKEETPEVKRKLREDALGRSALQMPGQQQRGQSQSKRTSSQPRRTVAEEV